MNYRFEVVVPITRLQTAAYSPIHSPTHPTDSSTGPRRRSSSHRRRFTWSSERFCVWSDLLAPWCTAGRFRAAFYRWSASLGSHRSCQIRRLDRWERISKRLIRFIRLIKLFDNESLLCESLPKWTQTIIVRWSQQRHQTIRWFHRVIPSGNHTTRSH